MILYRSKSEILSSMSQEQGASQDFLFLSCLKTSFVCTWKQVQRLCLFYGRLESIYRRMATGFNAYSTYLFESGIYCVSCQCYLCKHVFVSTVWVSTLNGFTSCKVLDKMRRLLYPLLLARRRRYGAVISSLLCNWIYRYYSNKWVLIFNEHKDWIHERLFKLGDIIISEASKCVHVGVKYDNVLLTQYCVRDVWKDLEYAQQWTPENTLIQLPKQGLIITNLNWSSYQSKGI